MPARKVQTNINAGGFVKWVDEEEADRQAPLTRQEAQAYLQRHPPVSVWWVVAAQVVLGSAVAALAWWLGGDVSVGVSALYGAAVVVVPGALMARGATSPNSTASPLFGAVTFLMWAVVKIGFSVLMLLLAPKIVQPLSWPALLLAMVLCMQTYWLALLWRRRATNKSAARDGNRVGNRTHGS
jgi:ATP synthase protein I